MSLILDEHREYLSDQTRLALFRKAIGKVVKPGDVVVDLGCGSGILGLFACQAGAARVYAIDDGGIIDVARQVAAANGFGDRITHLRGHSTQVELPEKADVLLADQIGNFGFEAGVFEFFRDGGARMLKRGGKAIPRRIDFWLAPVSYPQAFRNTEFWATPRAGFDFGLAGTIAKNTGYPLDFAPARFLGRPARLASADPLDAPPTFKGEVSIKITTPSTLHGLAGFFSAELAPGVTMTNSPLSAHPITRRRVFFPIDKPVRVSTGDRVAISMSITHAQTLVSWRIEVAGPTGGIKLRSAHSTLRGMLLTPGDLRKSRPDFVPTLTPWGEARRTVIALFDGRRTVAEIERELLAHHPELFPAPAAAANFVAEVVIPYGGDGSIAAPKDTGS
ncbi:MAG TPA: 50S ribosomal protein L11 methyltransferase [Candidatus Binataceae bacterium]|nr:50S ribosomal protein L11 methyltransferase [Candidatus Binataceae bacterium]